MKNLTYILAALLFLSSCTSIEKLTEQGNYNAAVLLAIKKLQGKKNKKTKHVQGLEEAFAKINDRDLSIAKRLLDQNRDDNWDELYAIYANIDDRQRAIEPLLPLSSKDGYYAKFNFIRVDRLLNDAAENAAEFRYQEGRTLLAKAKKGNKEAGRSAYQSFLATKRYFNDFKDVGERINEALYYGKTRVLVDVINNAPVFIPHQFEREVLNIHVRDLNTQWTEYYVNKPANTVIDVHAVLEINNMDISPEREVIHHYDNKKKIKDGYYFVKGKDGKAKLDSLGNKIKKDRFKIVRAHITEIQRTKAAVVTGNVYYYDNTTGEKFRSRPVRVEAIFEDFACQFTGDRRAIEDQFVKRLKNYPSPFPSDFEITMNAAENLKQTLKDEIKRTVF